MANWITTLNTAPSTEPITATEVKAHCRVDISDDDTLIGNQIKAARVWAEAFTGRQFVTATWEQIADTFLSRTIRLAYPPLASVTSVAYTDTSGDAQTVSSDDYQVDTDSEPGRLVPDWDFSWPSTQAGTVNAVTITYVAGYGAASAVPDDIKQALLMRVAHWYEHREEVIVGTSGSEVPAAVMSLLWPYRVALV